jgi:hypothetical protein
MPRYLDCFGEIVLCDFEYYDSKNGDSQVVPLCACAKELRSGREFQVWEQELIRPEPPWAHGPNVLFCTYNAPAELRCFIELKWSFPQWILDLCIEHRQIVNGVLDKKRPRNLLAAMRHYGLSGIDYWRNNTGRIRFYSVVLSLLNSARVFSHIAGQMFVLWNYCCQQ